MSRMVTIKSELIEEIDLAQEVVRELNTHSLSYNTQQRCFEVRYYDHMAIPTVRKQHDDMVNPMIQKAEKLYYEKRRARNIKRVTEALEEAKYKTTTKVENNKTKIVAVQRVYA